MYTPDSKAAPNDTRIQPKPTSRARYRARRRPQRLCQVLTTRVNVCYRIVNQSDLVHHRLRDLARGTLLAGPFQVRIAHPLQQPRRFRHEISGRHRRQDTVSGPRSPSNSAGPPHIQRPRSCIQTLIG